METNREILEAANGAVMNGDNEGFLGFCTDDTNWDFVGSEKLTGKDAVRAYMKKNYIDPPKFNVDTFISEGDYVTAIGNISMKDDSGQTVSYSYCDVWHFTNGKMDNLKAFVIKME